MNKIAALFIPLALTIVLGSVNIAPSMARADDENTAQWRATGPVIETMDSGGYTYVRVDTGQEKIWAAAPVFKVDVGQTVSIPNGAVMENYFSKTLQRSFDSILFVSKVQLAGGQAQPMGTPSMDEHPKHTDAQETQIEISGIAKPEGGKTIAEIFDARKSLEGQEVQFRARVVKFTGGIMGTNFIHVQDGTKSSTGANDLTVTSDAETKVGDTVLVQGKITLNKDFGYGYSYELLIENASVTVE